MTRRDRRAASAGQGERTYRHQDFGSGMTSFGVVCQETDLLIQADRNLERLSHELVVAARAQIEEFIIRYPAFASALSPWPKGEMAPAIVRAMIRAGRLAGVGPMAAVAGAVAESVGIGLLEHCGQVIVENGGDIYLRTEQPVVAGLFAGSSPLSMKVGIRITNVQKGVGLCTSSATVGHSLSMGMADAVCVLSSSCPLADAAATSIGNRIKCLDDIQVDSVLAELAGPRCTALPRGRSTEWLNVTELEGPRLLLTGSSTTCLRRKIPTPRFRRMISSPVVGHPIGKTIRMLVLSVSVSSGWKSFIPYNPA